LAAHVRVDRVGEAAMVRVLGPILFGASDVTTSLPSATQRRLLAILALHAPTPVRTERLADLMGLSPSGLRTAVTRLRRAVGDETVSRNPGGYRLTAVVDADVFCEDLSAVAGDSDAETRLRSLERAVALWRGPAFEEFAHEEWAAGAAARLDEMWAAAIEDHAEALVEAHRWSHAVAELTDHIALHPLRDRPRGLLMRALAGDGRQADALRAYHEYRQFLADEVATEPSAAVQRLERRIAGGWTGMPVLAAPGGVHRAPTPAGLPAALAIARQGPFVGRATTIDDLDAAWRAGGWRALIVAGEPGIGKTRLVAELAHRMQEADRHVVVARGDEDYAVSHRPWAELLDPIVRSMSPADLGALGPDQLGALARVRPRLPTPPPPVGATIDAAGGDPAAQRALLLDAVLALLRIAGPTVLVVDDLHWIDASSLAILRRVVAAAIPDLTVVGAYRDTDVAAGDPLAGVLADLRRDDGVRRVVLDGIDRPAVVALVERSTGRLLDGATISLGHAIHARTAGNPLFASALIEHLAEQRRSVDDDEAGRRGGEMPEGLVEIIGRRLARLGEVAIDVLRVAAAFGQRFDVGLVEDAVALGCARTGTAAGTTDVLSHLEQARDAGIVVDDEDGMSFRHDVIRSALLDRMSATRRRRLHRDIATVLERAGGSSSLDRHVVALAHHRDRARPLLPTSPIAASSR
jgi:DNA-binding SARP family transcriptional activator